MPIEVTPLISRLLVTFSITLISFLAYSPQYFLFHNANFSFSPWWSRSHSLWFNFCVWSIWISYYRCINTDPGGLPPGGWVPDGVDEIGGSSRNSRKLEHEHGQGEGDGAGDGRDRARAGKEGKKLWGKGVGRWCKRCEGWKPPRSHHCRKCGKCVLRMDHHCPWTYNCVGYRNLPHFLRFLGYSTYTAVYLEYHLVCIAIEIWDLPLDRAPLRYLILLAILILTNTLTTFGLSILAIRTIQSTCEGTTTIEEWEKERHTSLVRRRVVRKVIFPYDIGIWENIVEAMGGSHWPWEWAWVGSRTRKVWSKNAKGKGGREWDWEKDGGGGVRWEVNGFEDPSTPWPPPDQEREPFSFRNQKLAYPVQSVTALDDQDYVTAFRRRQQADLMRWQKPEESDTSYLDDEEGEGDKENLDWAGKLKPIGGSDWGGIWRNEDGATLADYGVDEEAEGVLSVQEEAAGGIAPTGSSNGTSSAYSGGQGSGIKQRSVLAGEGNAGSWKDGRYDNDDEADDDDEVTLAELLRRRRARAGLMAGGKQ